MNFDMELSRKPTLKTEPGFLPAAVKKILFWTIMLAVIAGLFFYIKKAASFYSATIPQDLNKKTYLDTSVFPVRGIHVTYNVAGSPLLLKNVIELVNKTELNALVIDLKEADGRVGYDSKLKIVGDIGAKRAEIKNLDKLLSTLKENNIFPIARICVFKDPLLAQKLPRLAVKDKNGSTWRDKKGLSWVDPYCKQVWEYNTQIAVEAAERGFREIQFDYVRFPSDGIVSNCVYTYKDSQGESAPIIAIRNFLKYAAARLRPYGVAVSVDVFGLTCSMGKELNIGQVIEEISPEVDYICPMVYPSHYYRGQYNLPDPEAAPYKTVHTSLSDAQRRIGNICRIRPWLQDFSLRIKYSANDVQEQIRAAYDNGIQEWLLWNPACRYTVSALKSKAERGVALTKMTMPEANTKTEIGSALKSKEARVGTKETTAEINVQIETSSHKIELPEERF